MVIIEGGKMRAILLLYAPAVCKSSKMCSHYFSYFKKFHESITLIDSFNGTFMEHSATLNTKTNNRML